MPPECYWSYLDDNVPINNNQIYTIAINDFLASGKERGLDYQNSESSDFIIMNQGKAYGIRQLVIEALKNKHLPHLSQVKLGIKNHNKDNYERKRQ